MQIKQQFSYESLSKYRNVLMGLQIILIIFFHFTEDCKIYDVRFSGIIYLFYKYIRSSGVDMFLLLSGIGLYFSWKRRPELKSFYRKRYFRILIPYLVVAIPSWLWLDVLYQNTGWLSFIKDIMFVSFFNDKTRWFWYILMIGICYWFFPYIYNIIESTADRISEKMRALLLCTVCTVLLVMLQLYHNELYDNVSIAVSRAPAFIIGVMVGKAVYEKRGISKKSIFLILALAIIIAWPLQMAEKTILGVYSRAFLNYAFSLASVYILVCFSKTSKKWLVRIHDLITSVFTWLGKYTLELYLIHVSIRKVMNTVGYYTYRLPYEGIMIIASVILAIVLNKLTEYVREKLW